jgi:hypothetical protein
MGRDASNGGERRSQQFRHDRRYALDDTTCGLKSQVSIFMHAIKSHQNRLDSGIGKRAHEIADKPRLVASTAG